MALFANNPAQPEPTQSERVYSMNTVAWNVPQALRVHLDHRCTRLALVVRSAHLLDNPVANYALPGSTVTVSDRRRARRALLVGIALRVSLQGLGSPRPLCALP